MVLVMVYDVSLPLMTVLDGVAFGLHRGVSALSV